MDRCDVKVEIVVDHHLESLSCQAFAFVLVDWLAVDSFPSVCNGKRKFCRGSSVPP